MRKAERPLDVTGLRCEMGEPLGQTGDAVALDDALGVVTTAKRTMRTRGRHCDDGNAPDTR